MGNSGSTEPFHQMLSGKAMGTMQRGCKGNGPEATPGALSASDRAVDALEEIPVSVPFDR